jgi:hypothetical protein
LYGCDGSRNCRVCHHHRAGIQENEKRETKAKHDRQDLTRVYVVTVVFLSGVIIYGVYKQHKSA